MPAIATHNPNEQMIRPIGKSQPGSTSRRASPARGRGRRQACRRDARRAERPIDGKGMRVMRPRARPPNLRVLQPLGSLGEERASACCSFSGWAGDSSSSTAPSMSPAPTQSIPRHMAPDGAIRFVSSASPDATSSPPTAPEGPRAPSIAINWAPPPQSKVLTNVGGTSVPVQ